MAIDLATNLRAAINNHPVHVHCWLNSMVALHWINGKGEDSQFVSNRVSNIQQHKDVKWHYVPTGENPAYLGSRGGNVVKHQLWQKGPMWLSHQEKWPQDKVFQPSEVSNAELNVIRSVSTATIQTRHMFEELLDPCTLQKELRICAWIQRFIQNSATAASDQKTGLLDASEIEQQRHWWIKRAQQMCQTKGEFQEDKLQLNLQPNGQGLLECRRKI